MNWLERLIVKWGIKKMDKTLGRLLKGELGVKTILAAATLVLLVGLQAFGVISAEDFEKYSKLAEALGLIGLRDAVARLPK